MTILPINTPIGSGHLSDPFDLNNTRETFRDMGLYQENETGPMMDKALDTAIRTFQSLNDDLKVDGVMKPGGETENRLFEIVTGQPHPSFRTPGFNPAADRKNTVHVIPERKPERKSRERQPLENKKEPSRSLFEIEPVRKKNQRKEFDFENRVDELDFNENGRHMWEEFIRSPFDAIKARQIAKGVETETKKQFPNIEKQRDNIADAFRHALWSVRLTREFGAEKAKAFTDVHERNRPEQSREALLMDLENNKIARDLALDPKNKDKNDIEIVREALDNGTLLVWPPALKGQNPQLRGRRFFEGRQGVTTTGQSYQQ